MKKLNLQIKGSAENMKLEKQYIYFKDETREPQLKIDNEQSRVFRFSITDYSLILFLPLL